MGFPLIITLILTPLVVLCLLPIYIIRGIVIIMSKIFRRDLSEILESRSTFLAVMDVYTNPKTNCLVNLIVEGGTSEEICIQKIEKFLTEESKGKLKYGRMQEYLTLFMGFFFWTKEKNFRVNDHFQVITKNENGQLEEGAHGTINANTKEISIKEFNEIQKELLKRAYYPGRSAWEVFLIKNIKPKYGKDGVKYDAVIFRMHHSLGDGYTLMKMFGVQEEVTDVKVEKLGLEQTPMMSHSANTSLEGNGITKLLLDVYTSIRAPFDLIYQILFVKPDENDFHLQSGELFGTANFRLVETERISMDVIKGIKNHFGVSFIVVILAAVTAGIRSAMLRRGAKVPNGLRICVPCPMPGHPDKMTNHWAIVFAEFPVGIPDSEERLRFLDKQLKALKRGIATIIYFKTAPWIGSLFYWMVKPFAPLIHPTGLLSDFPGPTQELSGFGGKVLDISFNLGFPMGRAGLMFTSLSYNGYWKMNLAVDHAILSEDEEVQEFVEAVVAEFSKLSEQIYV